MNHQYDFKHIFSELHKGLSTGDKRYSVSDREHIIDNKLGIEYHLYDDWFKITSGDEVVLTSKDANSREGECLMSVKKMLDKAFTDRNRDKFSKLISEEKPDKEYGELDGDLIE